MKSPSHAFQRLFVAGVSAVLTCALVVLPVGAASGEPDLLATLELPDGDLLYPIEPGTLHFYDEEDAPFAIQVIDGCALNDRMWVFGAGLSGAAVPLRITELVSGRTEHIVLPPFEPGNPVGTVLAPEALPICDDGPTGGLPRLSGFVTFTAAGARGGDFTDDVDLSSLGRKDAYRRLRASDFEAQVISKGSPVVAIDDSDEYDQLYLIAEGRTPRRVEGVVFSGEEGMIPPRDKLDKRLKSVTTARVRRAFETAKNGRVPQGIIEDLGLRKVGNVHHLDFEFETLGTDYYLAESGWIKDDRAIRPPQIVDERFSVELVRADGEATPVPLVGPLVGSDTEGDLWEYRSGDAYVEIIDACDVSGSFWTVAGALTDEPLELRVTDTKRDQSASHLLWTDLRLVSRMSDSSSLATCP